MNGIGVTQERPAGGGGGGGGGKPTTTPFLIPNFYPCCLPQMDLLIVISGRLLSVHGRWDLITEPPLQIRTPPPPTRALALFRGWLPCERRVNPARR